MRKRPLLVALSAAGLGIAAERLALVKRRRDDPASDEEFGNRRGVRRRRITLSDGTSIFIEEAGPETSCGAVFMHGAALRTDAWHYQLQGIGNHRLVFYDLRGHGRSKPVGNAPFSIRTLSEDLLAVIEHCRLERAVLVGHSIGGMIAMDLCHLRPDLVGTTIAGLVLVNTTYRPLVETFVGGAAIARLERVTRRPFDALATYSSAIDRLRRALLRPATGFWLVALFGYGPGASAKQIEFNYNMLADNDSHIIFELAKSYRAFDVRDVLGDIRVPALVISGSGDRMTLAEASEYIAKHLPHAELVVLEGCGHMTPLQRHREFNELVGAFLDETLGVDSGAEAKRASS